MVITKRSIGRYRAKRCNGHMPLQAMPPHVKGVTEHATIDIDAVRMSLRMVESRGIGLKRLRML